MAGKAACGLITLGVIILIITILVGSSVDHAFGKGFLFCLIVAFKTVFIFLLKLFFLKTVVVVYFFLLCLFGKSGVRDIAIYDPETDDASRINGGETCDNETENVFLFSLVNWQQVRVGSALPTFEEIGPFNLTRKVCIFDRHIVVSENNL